MGRAFADYCELPADEAIGSFTFIANCTVPEAPPPIRDCPDLFFDPPMILGGGGGGGDGDGQVGPQGPAGPQGPPGPPGGGGGGSEESDDGDDDDDDGGGNNGPGGDITFLTNVCEDAEGHIVELEYEQWEIPGAVFVSRFCLAPDHKCCAVSSSDIYDSFCADRIAVLCCANALSGPTRCLCFNFYYGASVCSASLRYDADLNMWHGSINICGVEGAQPLAINLQCVGGSRCSWRMQIDGAIYAPRNDTCSCDPFFLDFSNVRISCPCPGADFGVEAVYLGYVAIANDPEGMCENTGCNLCDLQEDEGSVSTSLSSETVPPQVPGVCGCPSLPETFTASLVSAGCAILNTNIVVTWNGLVWTGSAGGVTVTISSTCFVTVEIPGNICSSSATVNCAAQAMFGACTFSTLGPCTGTTVNYFIA